MHNYYNKTKPVNHTKKFDDYFKKNTIEDYDTSGVKCKSCYDCGFAFVNVDGANYWVFCECSEGKSKSEIKMFDLPRLNAEMKNLFKVNEFPLDHFIPKASDNRSMARKLDQRAREFRQYLKDSVKFWRT